MVGGLHQAPHGDEEGDGEVDYEAVVDAEGGVAVAYGVGDDGEGGVHRGGSASGDGGERSEHFRQQWGKKQGDHLAYDVGEQGDGAEFYSAKFGDEDARQRVVGEAAVYGKTRREATLLKEHAQVAAHDDISHHGTHPRAEYGDEGQEGETRRQTLDVAHHVGVEAYAHTNKQQ